MKAKTTALINKNTYYFVKDKHGNNYLGPLDAVRTREAVHDQEMDENDQGF
jgi:hypothetical protein